MSRKTAALAETMDESHNAEHLFNGKPVEITGELRDFLNKRIAEALTEKVSYKSVQEILAEELAELRK